MLLEIMKAIKLGWICKQTDLVEESSVMLLPQAGLFLMIYYFQYQ